MIFYEMTIGTADRKKIALWYMHLTIKNNSTNDIYLYYTNDNIYCKVRASQTLTLLNVLQRNLQDVSGKSIPPLTLAVAASGAASQVDIMNYGM